MPLNTPSIAKRPPRNRVALTIADAVATTFLATLEAERHLNPFPRIAPQSTRPSIAHLLATETAQAIAAETKSTPKVTTNFVIKPKEAVAVAVASSTKGLVLAPTATAIPKINLSDQSIDQPEPQVESENPVAVQDSPGRSEQDDEPAPRTNATQIPLTRMPFSPTNTWTVTPSTPDTTVAETPTHTAAATETSSSPKPGTMMTPPIVTPPDATASASTATLSPTPTNTRVPTLLPTSSWTPTSIAKSPLTITPVSTMPGTVPLPPTWTPVYIATPIDATTPIPTATPTSTDSGTLLLPPTVTPTDTATMTPTAMPSPTSTNTMNLTETPTILPGCSLTLPVPELALRGWEQRSGGTEVQLTVNNRDQIPDELFAAAPHLPPCGLNTNSSRTWVDIYSDGSRIYDFCGLGAADSLDGLWFFVSENAPRPHFVHIELNDRQCDQVYPSNTIEIPSSIPFSPLQSSSNQSTHSVPDTPTNRPQPIQLPPTNTQQPPSIPPTPTWTPMPDGG